MANLNRPEGADDVFSGAQGLVYDCVKEAGQVQPEAPEFAVDVRTAAAFLGVSTSLVYAYVERKQIPHYRMMGRSIRFRISKLAKWRQHFHVDGGIDE